VYKTWSYCCVFTLRFGEVYKTWSYCCVFTLRFGEVYKSWGSPFTLLVSRTISKAVPSPTVRYKCRWISKSHPVRASRARYLVTPLNYNAALYSRSEHTLWHCTADQSTHCGTVQQIRAHTVALYSRSEHTLWHCTADQSTHCGTVQQIWTHFVALYSRSEHTLWYCTADLNTHCGTVQQIWTHYFNTAILRISNRVFGSWRHCQRIAHRNRQSC